MSQNTKRMIAKPAWIENFEQKIARKIPLHPNALSSIKLFIITPLVYLSFKNVGVFPNSSGWLFFLVFCFCLLDYLDGVVAKERDKQSTFGGIYDRITDYPLIFLISFQCLHVVPVSLIAAKLSLDSLLLVQFLMKRGGTENRLRTTISYTTLIALLFLSQNWGGRFITSEVVNALVLLNIAFNAIVGLYNARLFQLRFIADALSAVNLTCGLFSIWFAWHNALEVSLLFLILGGIFDGFDGAAARKWGGTRWGVYSDDVADGVNYGIAPACAMFFTIRGWEGSVVGLLYGSFTISRLVYFTLNKETSDANFFSGVPSPVGGLIAMCSLVLFREQPVLLGMLIGMACIQMISFDIRYRHLGRAITTRKKRYMIGLPLYAIFLVLGAFVWGVHFSTLLLLIMGLGYGLLPSVLHLKQVLAKVSKEEQE